MIDYDNKDLVNNPKNPVGEINDYEKPVVDYDNNQILSNRPRISENIQTGMLGLGDSQWDKNTPLDALQNLDAQRAELQPMIDQFGNFLSQAVVGEIVGGTIEGLGYLMDIGSVADVLTGQETEWGNFITDFGQSIREGVQENTQIYEDPNRQEGFFNSMADPGWWFKNSVSVASTLSMLVPTMAATRAASLVGRGIGISKGLGAVRKAAGLSKELGSKGKWIQSGLSQAVVSRNIENWMEAHGTFEDYKAEKLGQINPDTGVNFTEEEATKLASGAAAENWKNGWGMLAQDMVQHLSIGKVFNPVTRKMETALGNAAKKGVTPKLKPWQNKLKNVGGTFLSEGGEESYQFYISERAKLRSDLNAGIITQKEYDKKMSDAIGSEEMMTSAFFGGLGGNVFQALGGAVDRAFKSKSRKEFEENMGKVYGNKLKTRAAQMQHMQKMLADADQEGLGDTRKEIIDNMMIDMTAEALENDSFEQFYETMEAVPKMTEEDKAEYAKESGNEFDTELAKSYTPEILKTAENMRIKYLKHRNKFDPVTASRLTQLETQNERLEKKRSDNERNVDELRTSMGDAWKFQATETQKKLWERKERGTVLSRRIKSLKSQKANTESQVEKDIIQKAIDNNQKELNIQKNETTKATKRKKSLDPVDQEQADNDLAELSYDVVKDEIISAREYSKALEDETFMNKARMIDAKSEEGQERVMKANLQEKFDEISNNDDTSEETVNNTKEAVKNQEFWTEEERKDINAKLDKKLEDILESREQAEATRLAEEHQARMKERAAETNEDPQVVNNQVVTPVGDIIEDPNADEDPNVSEVQLDKTDRALKAEVGSGRNMALLDKVNGTEAFQRWNENPKSKVGRVFNYAVSTRREALSELQNDAIQAYESAVKNGTAIPQSVYDNLPIQATLDKKESVFTFLPTKPTANSSEEEQVNYKRGYNEQRKVIIDKLAKGLPVSAKVAKSSGGDLITEYDKENDIYPENSIIDIVQLGKDYNNIEIMVSNEDGYLVDTNKEPDADLGSTFIAVGKDNNRNKMPYRGGVFLKVKKANGKYFPLRLNLLHNTRKQSEILSELLIKIAVPVQKGFDDSGKATLEKEVQMSSTISELDENLIADIEEHMAPELEMLDSKYKNPTLVDLINSFVYVSNETKNLTSELYMSGNDLFFGGNRMSPGFRGNEQMQEDLINFLNTKKRRQFSLNMWNENNEAYRKYVVDNNIINTNATTSGPLFQNTRKRTRVGDMTGRRIQLYMEPIGSPIESGATESDGDISFSNQSKKSELSEEKGFVFSAAAFGKKPDPVVDKTQEAEVSQGSDIQESDWTNFVDTGKVPQFKVNEIANKIINGKNLTDRELAIRTTYAKEIEGILRSYQKSKFSKPDIERRRQEELNKNKNSLKNKFLTDWLNDPLRKEGRRSKGVGNVSVNTRKPFIEWSSDQEQIKLETAEERQLWLKWKEALKNKDNKTKRRLEQEIGELVAKRILEDKINAKYDAELDALETTQESSDTQIRKEDEEVVSSPAEELDRSYVSFEEDIETDEFDDYEFGFSEEDSESLDEGTPETNCKKTK